ncbi:MtrAB system histidine kinase MtrB [Kitasatospora purpeofusca]|uniref:MtrAB system histidine kinase MtrB n=1 Tax=Kitasatospora purpeofusca TaxID=67352 RepID=UPI0022539F91|nr:MtrAB system histidine kinase MtrB [Kitasatospora purpeofusca]MCX4753070.1 MtrAB system histidine kinase MtrB [Kitasatospora purpeofusca]WSR32601.1 MtrAB system histidine kinase MtrB [Kitasatospora purpeofusca]
MYRADETPAGTATDGGGGAVRGDVLSSTVRSRRRRGPVALLALVNRQLRRPLNRVAALYRRSIQLRVVAATLLLSVVVVMVLGVVVVAQVRTGLLETKRSAARDQALAGFQTELKKIDDADDLRLRTPTTDPAPEGLGTWLLQQVGDLAASGQNVYSVIAMLPGTGQTVQPEKAGLGPRYSADILPSSIPDSLKARVAQEPGQSFSQPTRIQRSPESRADTEPGLVFGQQFTGPGNGSYQLYYVFSFGQETKTLGLVTGTLATAGVFVVIMMGGIAWLVVRQVVTPVRMAAGISERLAAGHLEERMKVTGTDDIARLGESFNRMANALQAQIRQLEELSRVQRRFVSDVSHELRTPLTTVRMAADLIYDSREDLDPMAARSAELLQGQLDRFESLLADLLEISRFDAGAAVLDAEPVDLREIVGRVVEAADPLAQAKGSAVVIRGDGEPVLAEVDSRRIERILRNLVVNALEHGEGRDVVVRLGSRDGAVAIGVRDYGIGLKPGEASRVFHRFWRADPSRVRTTGGTGLGLSIAVEDAHLHGGWLQAWGEPGGGSHFRLTMPRTRGGEISRAPFRLEPEDSRNNRGLGTYGAPYRRAARPAGATALTATDEQAVPETPDTSGSGFGSGLGGVLSIGPGLGRRPVEGPRADPSDVLPVGAGYGATGAQVVVDPTPGRPSVTQRTAGPDEAAGADGTGGTDTEGSQRAKDQRQD